MRKLSAVFAAAIVLSLLVFGAPEASAQGVNIYVGPGNPGYADYPPSYGYAYPDYGYADPGYGYAYPSYGYGRPYYGTYWRHNRRVARRVNRRWRRWY